MEQFSAKYRSSIRGVLTGFDRLVFRGYLRGLSFESGMRSYLNSQKVLLKDFKGFVEGVTERVTKASMEPVQAAGRQIVYLPSAKTNKEEMARGIMREQGITEGPICLLSSVELCHGYEIYKNRETQKLELVSRIRKCLHLYHYSIHPTFGFMNARIQTWFPFSIQICMNGREWLSRQMDREGLGYERHDNCFTALKEFERAQALMDEQLQVNWTELLDGIAGMLNPIHEELFSNFGCRYYWSAHQSEWATDLVFKEEETLRRLYPLMVRHGMTTFGSPDVLRFLGRKLGREDRIHPAFLGEVTSDVKTRQEGVRIKHRINGNSVKAYDKAYSQHGSVLRVETTLNQTDDFKVYRPKEGAPDGDKEWRPLRKGVADVHRRAQVSQASNERYLNALASVDDSVTLEERLKSLTLPADWKGKRVRALRPFEADDLALLEAVSRGEFAINGLRNRDLVKLLQGAAPDTDPKEARRRSARVTRQLRMLRAHGLIVKVTHTHRYQLTDGGRLAITALLTARHTPVNQLLPKAA